MKNCPNCGEEIQDNAFYCHFCKKSLIKDIRSKKTLNEGKCPYCLSEVEKEAVKCKNCGEWLGKVWTDSEREYYDDDDEDDEVGRRIFWAVVLVLCVGSLLWGGLH